MKDKCNIKKNHHTLIYNAPIRYIMNYFVSHIKIVSRYFPVWCPVHFGKLLYGFLMHLDYCTNLHLYFRTYSSYLSAVSHQTRNLSCKSSSPLQFYSLHLAVLKLRIVGRQDHTEEGLKHISVYRSLHKSIQLAFLCHL